MELDFRVLAPTSMYINVQITATCINALPYIELVRIFHMVLSDKFWAHKSDFNLDVENNFSSLPCGLYLGKLGGSVPGHFLKCGGNLKKKGAQGYLRDTVKVPCP